MRLAVASEFRFPAAVGIVEEAVIGVRFVRVGEAELPIPRFELTEATIPPKAEGVFIGTRVPLTSDSRKQTFQHVNVNSTSMSYSQIGLPLCS